MIFEMQSKVTAIILSAGEGSRMGSKERKQFMMLRGMPVLCRTVLAFANSDSISDIIVVTAPRDIDRTSDMLSFITQKPVRVIAGGASRAESARLGFSAISDDTDFVAIHDGARCLITKEDIEAVVNTAKVSGAATAGRVPTDTVKRVNENGTVTETLSRDNLFLASTPQVFSRELYAESLKCDTSRDTDDNMQIERIGGRITCVTTSARNIKITTPTDLEYAEYLLWREEK